MWVRPRQLPDDEVQVFCLGARAARDDSGNVLGERYELLELLGCGGTAAVYRALDRRTKATVAVKVLYAGAREKIGSFFHQEGRLTARIRSPHLVRAHDFGEDAGRPFIVFDLVPGESLASLYYERVMPWRELCVVILQVLDALAALHRLGIVHRDLKPDNVYLERKLGDEPHVTLLDLGFALVPPERKLTNAPEPSKMVFGTEGYIAPELLGGCFPEPRNDLYSVGALMYTMLTAQPVPDIGVGPVEMVIPSPRTFLPSLPPAVDELVMRALSDVEVRFQSAAAMAAAIRKAMSVAESVGPVLAPRETSQRGDRVRSRGRVRLAASSLCAGLVGAGVMYVSMRAAPNVVVGTEPTILGDHETPSCSDRAVPGASPTPAAGQALADVGRELVAENKAEPHDSVELDGDKRPLTIDGGATPARVLTSHVTETRPTSSRTRAIVETFEEAMVRLAPKARSCARRAGITEDPRAVLVRGVPGTGKVESVRVVNMGLEHPFARCIGDVIREAQPPLAAMNHSFTFFSRGGSP